MFFVPLLCTRSFVSVQSKPVETIIITHTKKVTLENIDNREPGPQFRLAFKNEDRTNPTTPPPSWLFNPPEPVNFCSSQRGNFLKRSRFDPDVLKGVPRPSAFIRKTAWDVSTYAL